MKNIFLMTSILGSLILFACGNVNQPASLLELEITKNGRFETIRAFSSQYLTLSRDVVVYLPEDYEDSESAYPVVYMHDGQNLFNDSDAAYGTAWEVDDAYNALIDADLIDPAIIVGINNTADRISEYTPSADSEYGGGNGDKYIQFIRNELIPYINSHYRTLTGPENTAIIGSSLGGLISCYAGLNYYDTFGMAGCVSSSFWWNNRALLQDVESSPTLPCTNVRFWIDAGTAEGEDNDLDGRAYMIEDARRMAEKLENEGWILNENLGFLEDVGKGHNEAAWEGRIDDILYFFLRKSAPLLDSVKLRTYMPQIGLTGINKTFTSFDMIFDTEGFTLTGLASDGIITATPANIINIANGVITADTTGDCVISAEYKGKQANSINFSVVDEVSENAMVVFNVYCPATTTESIFLAGNGGPVGADKIWQPDGAISTEKIGDTHFVFRFSIKRGASFSYKFTRTGSWATEEMIGSDRTYTNNGYDETADLTISSWRG